MTADTVGGVWSYALQLATALAPEGVRVALATMGAPLRPEQWQEARQVPHLEVFESTFKLEWMDDPWADVAAAGAWLLDLEERLWPDVVHLNGYAHGSLAWRRPPLLVGHSCVLSWWAAAGSEPLPAAPGRYQYAVARGLAAAGVVVAPSHAMLADLERYYGPLPQGQVIYNGRDPALFVPGPKAPFVLTVGRLWDAAKNVGALARSAESLAWPVYVAGEERHPEGGRPDLHSLRPIGRLATAALAPWYARAAIYALPARYEPFGLSALEAGLAGCALVLGDIPSLREIWRDAAVFVPPNDTPALTAALQALIADPARRAVLGAQAQARALQFTASRMAGAYLALYRHLAAAQAPAAARPVAVAP